MKTLLVPLDGGDRDEDLLRTALSFAARFKSHIEVLHVRADARAAMHSVGMAFPGSMKDSVFELAERSADEKAAKVRRLFDSVVAESRVKQVVHPPFPEEASIHWREEKGDPAAQVGRRGRLADMIVLARPEGESPRPALLESALFDTGRPLVIVPPGGSLPHLGSRIAICWNGSTVAAKAVVASQALLASAEAVTILTTGEFGKEQLPAEDLQEHLAWHGIKADIRVFKEDHGRVTEPMMTEAKAFMADLLVLGGYGTSRTRSFILGGVTRSLLTSADLPLFMMH